MNLKTRFNLWKLKREMGPNHAFKSGLRKDLNKAWEDKYGRAPWYQMSLAHPSIALSLLTLFLTGGSAVYAYSNPAITEGTALYPVKKAVETVEEAVKITPEAKAKFYLKKIERRETERQVLELEEGNKITTVKPKIKTENQDREKIEIKARPIIKSKIKEKDRKKEDKEEIIKRRIKKVESSIEEVEAQLEEAREIIEKASSTDVELRAELKERAEHRLEIKNRFHL